MPLVSVILTSYNHGSLIKEAIDSVLNQTFSDFELIIWDDASTDNSWAIIESIKDCRIKAIRNETNQGPTYGVNKAIFEIASGKYIAIHHSDDLWEINKLQQQVDFLESNVEFGAVFTKASIIEESGKPMVDENNFYFKVFSQPKRNRFEWLNYFFAHGNALCHPSVLIKKQCYFDCGQYRGMLAQLPDLDMWIRLCFKYEIHVLEDRLVRFRILSNEQNTSASRCDSRIRHNYEYYKLLQQYDNFLNHENIFKIFPDYSAYDRGIKTDTGYVLAKMCLDSNLFLAWVLAFDILFDILNNPKRKDNVEKIYGFNFKDFILYTGEKDLFSSEEILGLRNIIDQNNFQINSLNKNIVKLDERINKDTATIIFQEKQYNENITKLQERINKDTATIILQENQYNENINMYAAEIAAKDIKLKDTEAQISLLNQDINRQMHEINLLKEDITNLKQQLIISEKALTDMATSISWKVTKPLRDMRKNIKNVDK